MPTRYTESRIDSVARMSGGLLRVNAFPTRVGVFTYKRADGTEVRELRHPDEVFHADSLASLEDVAITIGHPPGGVTPESWRSVAVGHVRAGTVAKHEDGERVRAGFVLGRQDGISAAERKTHSELSSAYECVIDPTPGEYKGQRYDQAQTKIRYNHVAMLEPGKGRMGRECRLDAAGEEIPHFDQEEPPMKITINGKTYEGEAEITTAVTQLQARADAAEAQVKTLTATVARHDAEAAVAKRSELEGKVKGIMGPAFVLTRKDESGKDVPLTDRELRVAVIKRADSSFDDKGRDDVYVEARFDHALATSSKASSVLDALNLGAPPPAGAPAGGPPAPRADAADDKDGPRAQVARRLDAARKAGVAVIE